MNKRQTIEAAIINMINGNILQVGSPIPSIRKMSMLFGVSSTPVIEAYRHLEKQGIIESRLKSCYVVASNHVAQLADRGNAVKCSDDCSTQDAGCSNSIFQEIQYIPTDVEYCFSSPTISSGLIPGENICQYISRALRRFPELIDIKPTGYDSPDLVDAICRWMLRYKCIISTKEILIVNNDISFVINLALNACCKPNQHVFIASPCPRSHQLAAKIKGNNTILVRNTPEHGLDLLALERAIKANPGGGVLIIAPNFGSPLGALLSENDKETLVNICIKNDIAIVEDDSYGDLYFEANRPCSIKSLAPNETIYISTFSNSVAPGLQINWVCPGKYSGAFRAIRDGMASAPPAIIQSGFSAYVRSKCAIEHLETIRAKLSEAMNNTRELIQHEFPPYTYISRPTGGYELWIRLARNNSAKQFKQLALEHGISVITGEECSIKGANHDCFAINVSEIAKDPRKLEGIRTLAKIARKL